MPRPPPVTIATFPSRIPMALSVRRRVTSRYERHRDRDWTVTCRRLDRHARGLARHTGNWTVTWRQLDRHARGLDRHAARGSWLVLWRWRYSGCAPMPHQASRTFLVLCLML